MREAQQQSVESARFLLVAQGPNNLDKINNDDENNVVTPRCSFRRDYMQYHCIVLNLICKRKSLVFPIRCILMHSNTP